MSSNRIEPPAAEFSIVDLNTIHPVDLDQLWQQEAYKWRDRLFWDVPVNSIALLRALQSGSVKGRAVLAGPELIAYAYYYIVTGHRGVISALVVAPDWQNTPTGTSLLHRIVSDMHQAGVTRIECPAMSFDTSWQLSSFKGIGFQTYWREFLRFDLDNHHEPELLGAMPDGIELEAWASPARAADLGEAALVMQAAYDGSVDAAISELYRSIGGCRTVLQNLMQQSLGGRFVAEASARARHLGQLVGFSLITEISEGHAHLAQIVVLPQYHGQGIGRLLLERSRDCLQRLDYQTLSLIVSQANHRAAGLYQGMGFHAILSYPTFAWDR